MTGKESTNIERLLRGDTGHLWLFAQLCLLKQRVTAQQAQIDRLEQVFEEITTKSNIEVTPSGNCSRCGGILLDEQGRLVCTNCGDTQYL